MSNFIVNLPGKLKYTYMLCGMVLLFAACKKNDNAAIFSGTYKGRYLFANSGITYNHGELLSTFIFNNGTYTSTSHSNNPAANSVDVVLSGTYQIKADSISFLGTVITPVPPQPTQASLSTYQYHFEGDSLIITKSYSSGSFSTFSQYRLKRN
jgi:hypothetical protein